MLDVFGRVANTGLRPVVDGRIAIGIGHVDRQIVASRRQAWAGCECEFDDVWELPGHVDTREIFRALHHANGNAVTRGGAVAGVFFSKHGLVAHLAVGGHVRVIVEWRRGKQRSERCADVAVQRIPRHGVKHGLIVGGGIEERVGVVPQEVGFHAELPGAIG